MLTLYVNLSKSFNEICEGDNFRQQQFPQIKNSFYTKMFQTSNP